MTRTSFARLTVVVAAFLGVTYTLCVLYGLAVPASYRMYAAWEGLLPGFEWISWGSYFAGLGEALLYGVYAVALYALLDRLLLRKSWR